MPSKGSCLCGQVTVEVKVTPEYQYVCHCLDCRQTSGSAFAANFLAPKSQISISGPVKEFRSPAESGNIVNRIFCSNCGSAIGHGTTLAPDLQVVQTGIIQDFANVPVTYELYVKDRWSGLTAIPGAKQVDTMPEFEFIQRARDIGKAE